MSPKEKKIYSFIENHPGSQSGEVSEKLDIPLPTAKRILIGMLERKLLVRYGTGKSTNYSVEKMHEVKKDLMLTLTSKNRSKEFLLMNSTSFLEIKKILLTPLFKWTDPTEWAARLRLQDIGFKINCINNTGSKIEEAPRFFINLISLHHLNPVVTLNDPINISGESMWGRTLKGNEYPIKAVVEIIGDEHSLEFDVRFVYDAVLN